VGAGQARRRTVTVLFSDLVGSTELGERLDPETVREALDRYFAAARQAIERHGGLIEKFIGDALLAIFGLPSLHEDDALRAVRAALDMQDALAIVNETLGRDFDVQLHARTGVNTGEVVTGDPSAGERLVTGDAVNVAARLEQTAPADAIVIGETTFALVRGAVVADRLPPLRLKGKTDESVAYQLHSLARDRTSEPASAIPFVDRQRELIRLERMLSGREERAGRPIVIIGEAGIGKSRLVAEALRAGTVIALRGRCLPYGDGITYSPIVEVLRRVGEIGGDDGEELARRKLREAVEGPVDEPVVIEPLVSLLVGSATYPAEELARAFRGFMDALGTSRELALVFEDVHWAEPTFLDLIGQTARSERVPVVCTARPEFLEADGHRSGIVIELARMKTEDASELLASLVGEVAASTQERLVESSGGNPFFMEQIVSTLREEGMLDPRASGETSAVMIPASVAAVLDARLDRLPPTSRDVAERAAVVGQIFYPEAVQALGDPGEEVNREIADLISKGFVEPSPTDLPGQTAFAFRHILIRDAVYRGTLKRRRADWHERFGGWLEERGPGGAEEFVGFHLEQAHRLRVELGLRDESTVELASRASGLLATAGRRAADRNDASAASGLLARAIDLLPREPAGARVPLMVDLALADLDAGSVAEALRTARAASDIPDPQGDDTPQLRATAVAIMIEMHAANPDLGALSARARRIERDLQRLGNARDVIEATIALGVVDYAMGQMGSSAARLDTAAELANEVGDLSNRDRALDWFVLTLHYGPIPVSSALRRCEEIIRTARPRSRVEASARASEGMLHAMALDLGGARVATELSESIYEELGMPLEVAATSQARAAIELLAGDPASVEADLRRDRELLAGMNAFGYRMATDIRLAQVLDALGNEAEAAQVIEQIRSEIPTTDVVGMLRVASLDVHSLVRKRLFREAEAVAREAIERAATTDFAELVPVALTDLADVLAETGRSSEARELLTHARELHLAKENAALASRVEARLHQLSA
jgi:class 3 adenylate cyclase/tetratricopeptide (TPR) repeat protein